MFTAGRLHCHLRDIGTYKGGANRRILATTLVQQDGKQFTTHMCSSVTILRPHMACPHPFQTCSNLAAIGRTSQETAKKQDCQHRRTLVEKLLRQNASETSDFHAQTLGASCGVLARNKVRFQIEQLVELLWLHESSHWCDLTLWTNRVSS
jgi:hypothetical protein